MDDTLLLDRVVAAVGDRYDVRKEIGRGGMSVVYRATDVRLNRDVAIKVLPPELAFRADVKSRFLREAQTAARLSHPNIVPIYSVDEDAGIVCFVMGFVDGESLQQRLARDPRPPISLVYRVLRETADALGYAHAHGVVHRDVKPDNILIDRETGRCLVSDFGIARAMEGDEKLTVTGVAVGTPAYMSPEQALGEREIDGRSDIYALGIVGWQMMAGELPFRATSTPAMLMKHVSEPLPSLRGKRPDVPPALAAVLERALAKKPEDRWPDARAFRDAIEAIERGGRVDGLLPGHGTPPADASNGARIEASFGRGPDAPGNFVVGLRVGSGTAMPPLPSYAGAGTPELPPFPPFPEGGGRSEREDWRRRTREWREQVRAQQIQHYEERRAMRGMGRDFSRDMMRDAMRDRWGGLSIERQLRGFQGSVASYAVVIPGLALVNIATGPFPWVLFPAMGWGLGLLGQAAALRRAGVSPMDALLGRSEFDREERDRALAKGGEAAVAERVDRFKRTATIASVVAGVTSVAFVVGTGAHIHGLVAPFVVGAMATALMGIATLRRALALRPFGIRLRDAWNGTWREALSRDDPAMVGKLLDAEMAKRLPADVMSGPYGETVRAAAQDRAAILETVARLGPADRELIPDVVPTVKGLEERIAMLAGSLHRMAGDVSPDQLAQLTSRIATMEAGVGGADRERTLALLKRQRETLADLVERRENLQAQLDSATLLLQTIKLDLLRLRSAGVQSAIRDVSTATQEARALSKDIGNALDVAAELRKI